ncbi:MAG TPA: hypothetical protein VFF95_02170 [Candidatus Binatus sp.]|jgi:hypothetical protein|nr:hypothetical protein [Candidatus Binatus sp.]
MTPQPDKRCVLKSLVAIARHTRRSPSRREFIAYSGIPESTVLRFFSSWNAAVRAAGLKPNTRNQRHEDRELLEDWGRAVRKEGEVPTGRAYYKLGKFSPRTLELRFGSWPKVPEAFCKFARGKRQWADVLALLPPPVLKRPLRLATSSAPRRSFYFRSRKPAPSGKNPSPPAKIRHPQLRGRPTYGHPMDFRGLRHEPVNEQGVVLLFGMVAKELGYIVEAVQSGFPDCEAKRQISPQRWQRVHLEFEFESRNFRDHGHSLTGCDVIVCWRHNWPDCPPHLEILELSSLIKSLPTSNNGL